MRHRTDLFKTDKFGTGRRSPPRPAESETRSRGRARSCHRRGKARSRTSGKPVSPPAFADGLLHRRRAREQILDKHERRGMISVIWKFGFSRNRAAAESTHPRPCPPERAVRVSRGGESLGLRGETKNGAKSLK